MFFKLVILCTLVFGYSQKTVAENQTLTPQNFGLNGRIINGNKAGYAQFPWQAAINIVRGDRVSFCGGALISDEWILTAAHCIYGATAFSIRLGSLKSTGGYEPALQVISGERGIHHPEYNPTTFNNNVGLIKLAKKALLNQYVRAVLLPDPTALFPTGTEVLISGWGSTRTGGPISLDLNYVKLKTISNEQCRNYFNSEVIIHSTLCCKGTSVESTCYGDDGGALVLWGLYNSSHVGIASFVSSTGCEHGFPSVYARTVSFLDWIRENTGI